MLRPTFVTELKEFPDDCEENGLHREPSLVSINISWAVTTRAKPPAAPRGPGWGGLDFQCIPYEYSKEPFTDASHFL